MTAWSSTGRRWGKTGHSGYSKRMDKYSTDRKVCLYNFWRIHTWVHIQIPYTSKFYFHLVELASPWPHLLSADILIPNLTHNLTEMPYYKLQSGSHALHLWSLKLNLRHSRRLNLHKQRCCSVLHFSEVSGIYTWVMCLVISVLIRMIFLTPASRVLMWLLKRSRKPFSIHLLLLTESDVVRLVVRLRCHSNNTAIDMPSQA